MSVERSVRPPKPINRNAYAYQDRPRRSASPEDSVLVLIDHQPYQFANLHSHEPTMIVNNVVGLAKTANVFDVPTILTTAPSSVQGAGRVRCKRRLGGMLSFY